MQRESKKQFVDQMNFIMCFFLLLEFEKNFISFISSYDTMDPHNELFLHIFACIRGKKHDESYYV